MLLSKEELAKSAELHPRIAEHLITFPPPIPEPTDEIHMGIRNVLKAQSAATLKKLGPPPTEITELYHDIPMRDGYVNSLKIHKPSNGLPGALVVLCFGGGFIGGDNDQLSEYARALVKAFGATVVNIDYRLAPEYKFPYSQYDAWDSMKWIASNATGSLLSSDPAKGFIMGGMSAGSSLTAVLTRKYQEEPLAYPLTGQWLCVPGIMDEESCPGKYKSYYISREQCAHSHTMGKETYDAIVQITGWDTHDELHNAVRSKSPISGQPKTYFQIAGMDILRDDGLIYDEMLKEAGVSTKMDFYSRCPHGHQAMVGSIDVGKNANIDTIVGFGWLLGKDVEREEAADALGIDLPKSEDGKGRGE